MCFNFALSLAFMSSYSNTQWEGANRGGGVRNHVFVLTGYSSMAHLTELFVDDAHFSGNSEIRRMYGSERERFYLWMDCRRLERVSMKGQTWSVDGENEPVPVNQEAIIKFGRRHGPLHGPLRWLRSDLTPENVICSNKSDRRSHLSRTDSRH